MRKDASILKADVPPSVVRRIVQLSCGMSKMMGLVDGHISPIVRHTTPMYIENSN